MIIGWNLFHVFIVVLANPRACIIVSPKTMALQCLLFRTKGQITSPFLGNVNKKMLAQHLYENIQDS